MGHPLYLGKKLGDGGGEEFRAYRPIWPAPRLPFSECGTVPAKLNLGDLGPEQLPGFQKGP